MRALLCLFVALGGCAAPDSGDLFHAVELWVEEQPEDARDRIIRSLDQAKDSLHIALPYGEDLEVCEAIVDAMNRGVEIEVVTDIDAQDTVGILTLLEAGVPTTLADDAVEYFDFNILDDVAWPSAETIMSEGFLIVDRQEAIVDAGLGQTSDAERLQVGLRGEEILEDLLSEHRQLFGGADATSPTMYDGMAKSIADHRWFYPTGNDVTLELWFGPQQRLGKRLIDAIYGARGSVKILTDDFANEGMTLALEEKAASGFDVEVILGPGFESSSQVLSRLFTSQTPSVRKHRIDDGGRVPTIVIIDDGPDIHGTHSSATKAFVLSHPLYSSARLYRSETVLNDQLIDGTMLVFVDTHARSAELETFRALYERHLLRATEMN
jgi:hypothetical protein